MPRNNKNSWRVTYNEHDPRITGETQRRVSFKPGRQGRGKFENGRKDWGESIKAHLAEEDIDMNVLNAQIRSYLPKKLLKKYGRSDTPMPNRNQMKRKLMEGFINWYRITLPHGNKYDKQYIIRLFLEKLAPLTFTPITWSVNGGSCTFYIDDFKVAEKLHGLNRELLMPDGYKLLIRVSNGCPIINLNKEFKEKMKHVMGKRYSSEVKALDMSKFHVDPELQSIFCALFKPIILLTAIDIIVECIPEIEALNLQDNKLYMLTHLKKLNEKLPNLKILHIGRNKFKTIEQLDPLIGLPLVELVLDGNPLCTKFKDKEEYISEVRKRFPKVMKLDGIDLPPPIFFDISEEVSFPPFQQTHLCNSEGQGIVREFLQQYYLIMDSDNRTLLLNAYHEHAMFSMTSAYPYGMNSKNSSWLNWYNTNNRNLIKLTDYERRHKLLRHGQVCIVNYLQEMPASKHDLHNFSVDLNIFTPTMLHLSVAGVFKEFSSGHKVAPLRYFCRTFVIVPAGSGFCITNDELHISNATSEQAKTAFKTPVLVTPPASNTPTDPTNTITPDITALSISEPDDQVKQQMIQAMAQQSGMNLEWSQRCLAESNWDYQRASLAFTTAQSQSTIPPEAFTK